MHSTTCEAFLESLANECEGVTDAEASYVSETIRIHYTPGKISPPTLCDALSTLGYTAVPREEAPIDSNVAADQGVRQFDSVLGYRYAAGVVFGSFLMLVYVVLLYPSHLSTLLGEGFLTTFSGGAGFGGAGVLVLPLFLVLTGFVLVFTGLPLLRGAYVSVKMRQPNTELLASISIIGAFLYSTISVILGRADVFFDLTIVVAAVVVAAIFYESLVKRRAMDRLAEHTISQIERARRYSPDGKTSVVPVDELEPGDSILVRQGERIPADGVLANGECTVDESIVTGESLPIEKHEGDEVVGGSVVTGDAAVITIGEQGTSRIDRLITTVWDLQSAEHGVHRQANRLATWYIPVILGAALLGGGIHLIQDGMATTVLWVVLAAVMVVSPWALGLATPLSVATTIESAMQRGIIIFDETILERLRDIDVVVFDKTGTLTTGQMSVIDAETPTELLPMAAALEHRASHPAARAIAEAYSPADDVDSTVEIQEFETHSKGVGGVVDGLEVLVGHPDLFESQAWEVADDLLTRVREERSMGRLPVLVGRAGQAEDVIVIGDEPRNDWESTIARLSERGIDIIVLTGDDEEAAEFLRQDPHVDHIFAAVPPAGKTATVRRLQADQYVAMVGDGTNDAPALAQADLGIALGGGTAIASDAADIAIVNEDLSSVETAFDLAHSAGRRVKQNTALAHLYNVIAIPLALLGLLNPVLVMIAVVATGGALAANSFRPLLTQ